MQEALNIGHNDSKDFAEYSDKKKIRKEKLHFGEKLTYVGLLFPFSIYTMDIMHILYCMNIINFLNDSWQGEY